MDSSETAYFPTIDENTENNLSKGKNHRRRKSAESVFSMDALS